MSRAPSAGSAQLPLARKLRSACLSRSTLSIRLFISADDCAAEIDEAVTLATSSARKSSTGACRPRTSSPQEATAEAGAYRPRTGACRPKTGALSCIRQLLRPPTPGASLPPPSYLHLSTVQDEPEMISLVLRVLGGPDDCASGTADGSPGSESDACDFETSPSTKKKCFA